MTRARGSGLSLIVGVFAAIGLSAPAALANGDGAAEVPPPQPVTLQRLIDQVRLKNPSLQAKLRAYEAARGRVLAAWLPEDPGFGVNVEGQPDLFQFSRRTDNKYMVEQTIPFPTKLLLRAQIASREAQAAYQRYREEERYVIWHIEQPYYELFMTRKTLEAMQEVRALLEKLSRTVQSRYENNSASQQDLLKARIELSKIEVETFSLQQQIHIAEAHLSHLLDQSLETRYALVEEPPSPLQTLSRAELEHLAIGTRPELRAGEVGIKRAKAARLLADTTWLPDLTGRIEARQFAGESGIREYDTFLGITVPFWSLVKGAGGEWASASRDVQETEALYEALKNEVLLAVHEAHAKVAAADHAATTYEQSILPEARQQVEVALASYEAGRLDFLSLIDAERMLREAQIAYYKVKADREQGLSDLRLAVGSEIDQTRWPATTGGAR